jgi:hypothetical protein
MKIKDYPEIHMRGMTEVTLEGSTQYHRGDLGIHIAQDGRIWICLEGKAFLRFKPFVVKEDFEDG